MILYYLNYCERMIEILENLVVFECVYIVNIYRVYVLGMNV